MPECADVVLGKAGRLSAMMKHEEWKPDPQDGRGERERQLMTLGAWWTHSVTLPTCTALLEFLEVYQEISESSRRAVKTFTYPRLRNKQFSLLGTSLSSTKVWLWKKHTWESEGGRGHSPCQTIQPGH